VKSDVGHVAVERRNQTIEHFGVRPTRATKGATAALNLDKARAADQTVAFAALDEAVNVDSPGTAMGTPPAAMIELRGRPRRGSNGLGRVAFRRPGPARGREQALDDMPGLLDGSDPKLRISGFFRIEHREAIP
jgi:hypothetical protein